MQEFFQNLPKLGFGTMRLPETNGEIDIPRFSAMVDQYMASGMNYFDTAYMYHEGKSETAIRKALVERYPRASYYLTDKLPVWLFKKGASPAEERERIFNDQLERTGAGYFDVYLLHSVEDAYYDKYEQADCFNWAMQKKEQGLIRHFGFSFHGTPELLETILEKHPEVEVVQIQLNYADWDSALVQSGKLWEILKRYDKPIFVMEPVKGGILCNLPENVVQLMQNTAPGLSVASWAIRFAASCENVVTVLSGMSNEEQMADNIRTLTDFRPLDETERGVIAHAAAVLSGRPTVACTACRYCCEGCPQGIEIPEIFKALNAIRIHGDHGRPHFFYAGLIRKSGRARSCVECGQCESVCPQHLNIITLLKEASSYLDKT